MEPLQYYASGEQLDRLCQKFGGQLELLDRTQKLQLRTILTYFVLGREMMGGEYSINDALVDSLQHLFVEDPLIEECLEILQGITVQNAESLQIALVNQCTHGNARLKTATETMTDELMQHGISAELAKTAAYILVKVDNSSSGRSPAQQEIIDQVHSILTGVKQHGLPKT
ncbi:hypothetical protein F7734_52165 [Scytonema sp. UIC 10036]|uniref:hypothetical protein n=1 Tax=Scytonema sp. UIC 10036 TaxID=2304196 RepID=UPI0012DABE77|nr:hypothetical protein [Scytonema sp. UIC 10036]MUH00379.1 hypothetical protein [Scytonema sp. UIC 10036]